MDGLGDHNGRSERCAIAIMAKAPGAGRIKTRLSPLLSPQEANALGCCFLRDMTANLVLAAETAPIDPYVAFAPAGSELHSTGSSSRAPRSSSPTAACRPRLGLPASEPACSKPHACCSQSVTAPSDCSTRIV